MMNGMARAGRRLWFGLDPAGRKSRFHTQKGTFCLRSAREVLDCGAAIATGLARKIAGIRPVLPWITFPALRFLRGRVTKDTKVFEWSCGMSTLWFERRCREVVAVEDDRLWHARIAQRARTAKVHLLEGRDYVEKILEYPAGYFDLVSVDGSHRLECFRMALEHTRSGAVLVVDNTDNDRGGGDLLAVDQMIDRLGPGWEVHRFPGWGPGNFFAWETTVCVRR